MRIAYIGKFSKLWDEEGIAVGLEAAGAEVVRIEERTQTVGDIKAMVERAKPDVVLGAKYDVLQPDALMPWLKERYPTVSWTFDLLLGHPPREQRIRTFHFLFCDLVFLTDGGHMQEYADIGVNAHLLRQGIPDEFCYMAEPEEGPDVLFVGTENPTFPYRQELMKLLKHYYGANFQWVGRANAESCRGHDLNKLYASAKVVIGDCMHGDHYWSNRVVETLGRGGFLIHPNVVGIDKDYTPYKEFVPYDWGDFKGLKEKIDYFLDHPKERDKIRRAGFARVEKEYKMSDKCKTLYEAIKQHKRQLTGA